MEFDSLLKTVSGLGSFFLMPLFLWAAYFLLSHFLDYPAELEKQIKEGKVWPYLPMYWKNKKKLGIRTASNLLFWSANIFGACTLYYLFPGQHILLIAAGFMLSIFISFRVRHASTKSILRMLQDRYFQIYTQLASQAMSKGSEISDSELLSRAQWQHNSDLRLADKQGKFLQYLKGEATL